ncbi:endonuclease VII domain-containing protein [Streptomyces sp. NBC_01789]|uniref:endonuclease VII domain-containing protein n=1 Tax=Streptomyces sp. NBC_01789 TaxID=2975941 RepID=UPI002258644B|nr:endonuclease VII domain-containing protein [Streptomyces sp. NBC_01789]MCX4450726.1 endonuclease VII domain-containing protein [Streptomyces sp. NBC_01789]
MNNAQRRADLNRKRCRTCLNDLPAGDFELTHRSCRQCEALRELGMKVCKQCGQAKPINGFHLRRSRPEGRDSTCRACRSDYARSRNAIPEQKIRARENSLRLKYGIGIADVEAMLEQQGGRCAICRTDQHPERFHVDHNHQTGEVRAMLCLSCNALLGHSREEVRVLLAAVDYLKGHSHDPSLGP